MKYHDSEGNECTLYQLVRREPDWAESRVRVGREAIDRVKVLESALQAIIELPSSRQDECCCIAMNAMDTD